MKNILLLALLAFAVSTYANDEDDIHPRCPFKYYKNVDKHALCRAYDNEMGDCEGDSQIECSDRAFKAILKSHSVKEQEISFDDEEDKTLNKMSFDGCKFTNLDKVIECDGKTYVLKDTGINDISRDIYKKLPAPTKVNKKMTSPSGGLNKTK